MGSGLRGELTVLNHDHDQDFDAHVFAGPSWDDPEAPKSEPGGATAEVDEDDFEAHASGFGRPD
jgi:hypothetical protein